MEKLAQISGAQSVPLPVPGICESRETRDGFLRDASSRQAMELHNRLSILLVGIGNVTPSRLLEYSGNAVPPEERERLRNLGAVGDICLRFYDEYGNMISSPMEDRVIGISTDRIRAVNNLVAVGGGVDKFESIRGALRGGWVNALVTDRTVAEKLSM
jgi:DNA-binding transcriptional regulator LsrR (DeoR family)